MPEYVLKLLFYFDAIDDVEARADMKDILAKHPDADYCEYILRGLKRGHGGRTAKTIASGDIPESSEG